MNSYYFRADEDEFSYKLYLGMSKCSYDFVLGDGSNPPVSFDLYALKKTGRDEIKKDDRTYEEKPARIAYLQHKRELASDGFMLPPPEITPIPASDKVYSHLPFLEAPLVVPLPKKGEILVSCKGKTSTRVEYRILRKFGQAPLSVPASRLPRRDSGLPVEDLLCHEFVAWSTDSGELPHVFQQANAPRRVIGLKIEDLLCQETMDEPKDSV